MILKIKKAQSISVLASMTIGYTDYYYHEIADIKTTIAVCIFTTIIVIIHIIYKLRLLYFLVSLILIMVHSYKCEQSHARRQGVRRKIKFK